MINAMPWTDAEEWPESRTDQAREGLRDIIEHLENIGPIKRATEKHGLNLSPSLKENRKILAAFRRRLFLHAEKANGLN